MVPAPQEIRRGTFTCEIGSQAPKVYIRAVMFRGTDEILLVSDKIDGGKWTLPGGWADVGQTPVWSLRLKEQEKRPACWLSHGGCSRCSAGSASTTALVRVQGVHPL